MKVKAIVCFRSALFPCMMTLYTIYGMHGCLMSDNSKAARFRTSQAGSVEPVYNHLGYFNLYVEARELVPAPVIAGHRAIGTLPGDHELADPALVDSKAAGPVKMLYLEIVSPNATHGPVSFLFSDDDFLVCHAVSPFRADTLSDLKAVFL